MGSGSVTDGVGGAKPAADPEHASRLRKPSLLFLNLWSDRTPDGRRASETFGSVPDQPLVMLATEPFRVQKGFWSKQNPTTEGPGIS